MITDQTQDPNYQEALHEVENQVRKIALEAYRNRDFLGMHIMLTPIVYTPHLPAPAAVDGLTMYINPVLTRKLFLNKESRNTLPTLLKHEIAHLVLGHCSRIHPTDRRLSNMAADVVVNGIIDQEIQHLAKRLNISDPDKFERLPAFAFRRVDLESLSSEEIYEILLTEKQTNPHDFEPEEQDFEQNLQDDLLPPDRFDENGKPRNHGQNGTANQDQNPDADTNPSGNGAEEEQHQGGSNPANPNTGNENQHNNHGVQAKPMSEAEIEAFHKKARDTWATRTLQVLQNLRTIDASFGTHPLGHVRDYAFLESPQLHWRELLWQHLSNDRSDYGNYNMHYLDMGFYEEEIESHTLHLHICIDTSGSITERDLSVFMTEVKTILETHPRIKCELYFADTALYGPYSVETVDDLPASKGKGGTSFVPFFQAIKKELQHNFNKHQHLLLYFTDGEGTFPTTNDRPENVHCIWLIQKGGANENKFPEQDSKARFTHR